MGSKIDGPSGPRPRFFLVGHGNFQRGIGHYTWLGCKSDISEEVRFFIVGLFRLSQRIRSKGIDHIYGVQIWWSQWSQTTISWTWSFSASNYTWHANLTFLKKWEVINLMSYLSFLWSLKFRTTNSIAFKLHLINETVTNRAALNWFRAPKRFNLWLSGSLGSW